VQTGDLLVATVGLAGEVNDGDDGPFPRGIPVCIDEVANGLGQGQRLGNADLSFAGTIKPVTGVGNHGEIAGVVRRRRKDRRDDRLRCDAAQGV
jgi:hypothetical protein